MKMTIIKKYIGIFSVAVLGSITLGALQSCRDDLVAEPGFEENPELKQTDIFIDLKLSLPTSTSTRATTDPDGGSSEGTMNGEYNENRIVDGLRMLFYTYTEADPTSGAPGNLVYIFELGNDRIEEPGTETVNDMVTDLPIDFNGRNDNTNIIRLKVGNDNLDKLAGNSKVRVFVIGNYKKDTDNLRDWITGDNQDPVSAAHNNFYGNETWTWISPYTNQGNNVPVVSRNFFEVDFSDLSTEDVEILNAGADETNQTSYNDALERIQNIMTKAFDKKTLELERICARIDFADGSPDSDHPYVYPINYDETNEDKKIFVKMESLNVFNMQKRGYLFRHTAPGNDVEATYDENNGYAVDIFGFENDRQVGITDGNGEGDETGGEEGEAESPEPDTSYRWVLDCAAKYKREMANSANWNTELEDNFFNDRKKYNDHFINVAKTNGTFIVEGDKTYTFVLEDLFSKDTDGNFEKDNYAVTSGGKTRNYFPVRYIPENTLPSQKAMIRGLSTGVAFKVLLCDAEGNAYTYSAEDLKTLKDKKFDIATTPEATGAYQGLYKVRYNDEDSYVSIDSDGKIYLTYYYFLRHNWDSSNPKKGAPMKFGVVRNNIYRLCVTGFDGLPVPFDPQDPDENDYAIAVELKVLAWVKRDITVVF